MVKKFKQMAQEYAASRAALLDTALAGQVKDSAQQIWLAGMGAFARAQAQGTKVFEALVKEGTSLQQKTQSVAEERISEASSKISDLAGDVQAKAGQQWDKLEGIFEARTAKALNKLGVPSAKDVDALLARLDALGAQVAAMGQAAPVEPAAQRAATPRKAACASAGASTQDTGGVKSSTRTSTKAGAKVAPKAAAKSAPKASAKTSPQTNTAATAPARKRASTRKPAAA